MTSTLTPQPDTPAELPPVTDPAGDTAPAAEVEAAPASPAVVESAPAPVATAEVVPAIAPALTPPSLSPAECAEHLKRLFPALFTGPAKPLKLRIQADIQQRAPGLFTKQALSGFLRRHTGSHSYLLAISKGSQRFDLDGAPAGELSAEHRQVAADELARRRGNQQTRLELEAQQRRNRAQLLHDFERTTLTPANFCALKGIGVDELDGYLATAREEAKLAVQTERAPARPPTGSPDRPPRHPSAQPAEFNRPRRPPQPRRPDRSGGGGGGGPGGPASRPRPPR